MEFRVRQGLQPHRVQGVQLAEVSTERPLKHRWMEMSLYKVSPGGLYKVDEHGQQDGDALLEHGGYVTYVIGQSVRTHRRDSRCGEGVPVRICDLPLDAQPCPDCRPEVSYVHLGLPSQEREERRVVATRQGNTALVDLEVTRHTIYPVLSAQEVYEGITRRGMSVPAERLLRIAATIDEDIAAILARLDAIAETG